MVPLGQVFDKLSRVVRKISRDAGKEIRLTITGADTELDKLIVEELSDPLMHVIRNCIDHGIEPPEERERGRQARGGHDLRFAPSSAATTWSSRSRTTARGLDETKLIDKAVDARRSSTPSEARELSRRETAEPDLPARLLDQGRRPTRCRAAASAWTW